jgi:hypothetical protein
MTVKELIEEQYNDCIADYEVYAFIGKVHKIHGDFITNLDEVFSEEKYQDYEVESWEIMDEERYKNTIVANSTEEASFSHWYNDENAKVLVIVISEEFWRDKDE